MNNPGVATGVIRQTVQLGSGSRRLTARRQITYNAPASNLASGRTESTASRNWLNLTLRREGRCQWAVESDGPQMKFSTNSRQGFLFSRLCCRTKLALPPAGWGQFLTFALNFLIIAWVLFMAIRGINKLKKEEPAAPAPGPTPEVKLLTENPRLAEEVIAPGGCRRHEDMSLGRQGTPLVSLVPVRQMATPAGRRCVARSGW